MKVFVFIRADVLDGGYPLDAGHLQTATTFEKAVQFAPLKNGVTYEAWEIPMGEGEKVMIGRV